jgi:hypothetical protein
MRNWISPRRAAQRSASRMLAALANAIANTPGHIIVSGIYRYNESVCERCCGFRGKSAVTVLTSQSFLFNPVRGNYDRTARDGNRPNQA